MRRLQRFFLFGALLLVPAFAGCGGGGGGEVDMGPDFEPLDAGNSDVCTNSQVTCPDSTVMPYQYCLSEDETSCYVRRMGMNYACDACGVVGGCVLAVEELVAAQCP